MAGMKSIDEARDALDRNVYELASLIRAFNELAREIGGELGSASWPAWLFVMEARVEALQHHVDAYTTAVHQEARPVLEAMERVLVPFPTA